MNFGKFLRTPFLQNTSGRLLLKAVSVDTILPKLIKIGADIITEFLTQAINCCLRQGILSNNANIASVVPLDKRKPDVLNYRPGSSALF